MITFKIKIRKRFFWEEFIISGFRQENDRMCLFFEDGSCLELSKWSRYDCQLGTDYFDAVKKIMEQKAGQSIPTNEVRK